MNAQCSNDLVSISIDTLDRVTGGYDPDKHGPQDRDRDNHTDLAKTLAEAVSGRARTPAPSGATVHGNYYY